MNRFGAALFFFLCLAIPVLSQNNPAPPAAPGVAVPTVPADRPADYSQEPFVIEQYFTSARFESDGTDERDLVVRMRVQSERPRAKAASRWQIKLSASTGSPATRKSTLTRLEAQ